MEFLTQVSGILSPFAWIMGVILNAIYEFVSLFGIHNIALCIFLFTFVMKMLMMPLTIKQQKWTRLSSRMSPELTKIQEKYKGKKDEVSLRKQQAETQEVYAKYGTSPMGGCLPLLITLPIMFALYRVIYAVPAYVTDVGELYRNVSASIQGMSGHIDELANFITNNNIAVTNEFETLKNFNQGSEAYTNSLIDILVKFNPDNWKNFFDVPFFNSIKNACSQYTTEIISVNNLFGLNILDTPSVNSVSVVIPVLAVVSQYIQGKLQNAGMATQKQKSDNPMANSSKTMMTIMPLMSGVFCLMLPIGVGVYWIATAIFTIVQTIIINKYLDKTDINELIEKNIEKSTKRKSKIGVDYGNKMAEVAKTSTKAIDSENRSTEYKKNSKRSNASDYKRSNVSYSASSIAANANLLSGRTNSKNNDEEKKEK